ncbi:autotransporter outer membrane beta-barrel domain-containing protein [Bartonella taylorii]|uniref:autotransporter outer membrane beta-barrel domain-containing protein n=1 Tax=Bartonella taylorii TaxID=33046 RepID=UPI001ABB842C|nr:autotransporter outer membrane beta-barrel domain-containing protein [Bartonella taylorii]
MVNIFKSYKFLFSLTTAAVSFFSIVVVSANSNSSRVSCDSKAQFYTCSDGKEHELKDKTYQLPITSEDQSVSAISVGKQGTIVNASQITVMGDNSDTISVYGVSVEDGGMLFLDNSNFKNAPSLQAKNGIIRMKGGKIEGTSRAIYAEGRGANVVLNNVNIGPGDSRQENISIFSNNDAKVTMVGGRVNFEGGGSFESQLGGEIFLSVMTVNGKGKKHSMHTAGGTGVDTLSAAFKIFQGGEVTLGYSTIQLTDMHGFLITNFSGYADDNDKLIENYNSSDKFKKTSITIKNSDVSVQGEGAYGLYFNTLEPEVWANLLKLDDKKRSETKRIVLGTASAYLSNTTFRVPDGIAIYSTGPDGYGAEATLELSERTRISGDLLLKAQSDSFITVKASDSTLAGDIRVEDTSTVDLELTRGSTWYLTQSKYYLIQSRDEDSQEDISIDTSVSSISLSDSTIVFDKYISKGYQTLRIGKKTVIDDIDDISEIGRLIALYRLVYKDAYSARGNSRIKLGVFLNDDGSFDTQKVDRILIYGNISGETTLLQVEGFFKKSEKEVRNKGSRSVSVVQVSGDAREDSFQLMGNYIAINGLPYQYRLRGYGPGSSFGKADPRNRLVAGNGDFWDFRLEGIYVNPKQDSSKTLPIPPLSSAPSTPVDPSSTDSVPTPLPTPVSPTPTPLVPSDPSDSIPADPSSNPSVPIPPTLIPSVTSDPSEPAPQDPAPTPPSPFVSPTPSASDPSDPIPTDPSPTPPVPIRPDIQPELGIRAVVPQLPTYLLLPNALFHAGLLDLTTQNKKLEAMRSVSQSSLKSDENSAFFIRGYGGSHHYASNLSAFEYGYGAELDYTALEAGVLLKEIESLYSRTFFGVTGTYGNLSLHPLKVEQSKKSPFDKWSVSAYGSLHHDTGFYMDGLLSYGLFRGDVFTLARGKAATLKGKQLSTSLISGKTFTIGHNGVVFDPQLQLVYQHLQFNRVRDVDDLDVDMGKFDQWTARFGGRLTKMFAGSEKGRVISFYSKLYLMHSFGERQFVSFKKDFQLGDFGSSLEAGLGFSAKLSAKFVLHGDINYQHRLTKAGFSGISFSAGLRHLF